MSKTRVSRDLEAFIREGTRDSYVNNAGIIGGAYAAVFEPFRRWLVSATRAVSLRCALRVSGSLTATALNTSRGISWS